MDVPRGRGRHMSPSRSPLQARSQPSPPKSARRDCHLTRVLPPRRVSSELSALVPQGEQVQDACEPLMATVRGWPRRLREGAGKMVQEWWWVGGVGRGVRACVGKAVGRAGGGLQELPVPRSGGRSGKGRRCSAEKRGHRAAPVGGWPRGSCLQGARGVRSGNGALPARPLPDSCSDAASESAERAARPASDI